MVAKIKELMGNTKVNAHVDGKMDLANIEKAYPVPSDLDLKGILNADITTAFDMASIESKQYENTQTTGQLDLSDFEYASEDTPNPIKIQSTSLTFNPNTVTLKKLDGATGQTDFNATGTITNLLGFMFNDEKIEGNFDLKSDTFALNDFMVEEEGTTSDTTGESDKVPAPSEEKIKIPSFLDANINASANTVTYGTSSDRSLKENDRPIPNPVDRVKSLNPVLFDWISDGTSSEGIINKIQICKSRISLFIEFDKSTLWAQLNF
jgi:hypothetical protein